MNTTSKLRLVPVAVLIGLMQFACGDGPTSPPLPTRAVVTRGTFSLSDLATARAILGTPDFAVAPFTTSAAGNLDVIVDWTSTSNDVDIAILRGNCSIDQVRAAQCSTVIESTSLSKPERLSSASFATGSYTLLILNYGPGRESGTYEVGLTR